MVFINADDLMVDMVIAIKIMMIVMMMMMKMMMMRDQM